LESSRKGGINEDLAFARNPQSFGVLPRGRIKQPPDEIGGIQRKKYLSLFPARGD